MEMEDLNYYYANYSRYGRNYLYPGMSSSHLVLESIMMSLHSDEGLATCEYLTLSLAWICPLTYNHIRTKLSLSHALSQSVKISLVSISVYHSLPIPAGYKLCHFPICVLMSCLWCPLWTNVRLLQFEALISSTIEETKDIPEIISETGKIGMPHKGTLFFSCLLRPS